MTDLTTLGDAIDAETLLPGDAGYEAVRPAYYGVGDPAAIVRPSTPEQVADALRLAQERDLPVSVRSGGHGAKAFPNPGGLVIDMARFDSIEVLPGGTVRVGAGATWGAVADAHVAGWRSAAAWAGSCARSASRSTSSTRSNW